MNCSEFLSRFSEFYDAPHGASVREQAEAHMAECGKCTRYQEVVSRSVALLHAMPKVELAESFRARLQHRLYHLDDPGSVDRPGKGSATPVVTVLGMAVLIAAIAWAPRLRSGAPVVDLPAIVVSGPPMSDVLLEPGLLGPLPMSTDLFSGGLWSDAESLLYEYSSMGERYRSYPEGAETVLRRTGLD